MDAWVPLFQTLAWILFIVGVGFSARKSLPRVVEAITERIAAGDRVEMRGPAGTGLVIGEQLRRLPPVEPRDDPAAIDPPDWTRVKDTLGKESRGLFLAHVIGPNPRLGERWYDIFVYLVGHKREDFGYPADQSDVLKAEFFLGKHWGQRIYEFAHDEDGLIGLRTSAYGPVLCVCRVTFRDGHSVVLNRYLDFEMVPLVSYGMPHALGS